MAPWVPGHKQYGKKTRKEALVFFSTDTVEEAESLIVALCSLDYEGEKFYYGSPFNPFPGTLRGMTDAQKRFSDIQKRRVQPRLT